VEQAFLKMVHVTAFQIPMTGGTQRRRKSAGVEKVKIASLATTHYLSSFESATKLSENAVK
jgi:hypothetical protein